MLALSTKTYASLNCPSTLMTTSFKAGSWCNETPLFRLFCSLLCTKIKQYITKRTER